MEMVYLGLPSQLQYSFPSRGRRRITTINLGRGSHAYTHALEFYTQRIFDLGIIYTHLRRSAEEKSSGFDFPYASRVGRSLGLVQ